MTQERNISDYIERLSKVCGEVMGDEGAEEQRCFSLCLAELYFRSQELVRHIDSIAGNEGKTEKDVDALLTAMANVKIELYDEMADWMEQLRRPLEVVREKAGRIYDEGVEG